jgi:hypothetical protein
MSELLQQIESESRSYESPHPEQLQEMDTEALKEGVSRLCAQLEKYEDDKRAISGSYGSLIKRLKADLRAVNREIRNREEVMRSEGSESVSIKSVQSFPVQ